MRRRFSSGSGGMFAAPDIVRVMDLLQEQLARSMDEGHDFEPEWLQAIGGAPA